MHVFSVCLYGGGSRVNQVNECTDGVHISEIHSIDSRFILPLSVIATPGRLGDLACEGVVQLSTVSYAVLDEVR